MLWGYSKCLREASGTEIPLPPAPSPTPDLAAQQPSGPVCPGRGVHLQILGSGGPGASAGRASASYLVGALPLAANEDRDRTRRLGSVAPFQGSSSSSPVTSLWVSLMKWSSSCCPPVSVGPASLHRPHDSASGIPRLKSIWRLSTPCPASPCRRARKASRLPSCRPTRAEPGERRRRMNSRPRRQAPAWARRSPRRSRAARPTTSASMTRWPVLAEEPAGERGREVGFVTSAVWSPRLERNIGYAMVPTALARLETRLSIAAPEGEREARVVPKPFVDPDKEIPNHRKSLASSPRDTKAGSTPTGSRCAPPP